MTDETPTPADTEDPVDAYAEQLLAEAVKESPKPEPQQSNPWDDPARAKAEIEKLRRENASDRVNAKKAAADEARSEFAQTIGKALGLVKDDPVDPAELTKQIAAEQAKAQEARLQLAVFQNATAAGADPAALLDSSSFLAKASGLDVSDSSAIQAAIQAAVEANPRLAVAQTQEPPPARLPEYTPAGENGTQAPGKPVQLTRQDIQRMTPEQINKAREDGALDDLLSGKFR